MQQGVKTGASKLDHGPAFPNIQFHKKRRNPRYGVGST
jgi:hypothetical protein